MTSRLAIVGSGRVATVLAAGLVPHHPITIVSRDVVRAQAAWRGPVVDFAADVGNAEIVINASPGDSSVERFSAMREVLRGRILVDVANATRRGADGLPAGLLYPDGSLAEALQAALPETHVVKTLSTMLFVVMAQPSLVSSPSVFLSGDNDAAKAAVRALLVELGWPATAIDDLGALSTARAVEAMVGVVPHLLRTRGFAPFALSVAR